MNIDWLLVFVGACILALVALWVYRPKPPAHRPRRERSDLSPPIQRSSYVSSGTDYSAASAGATVASAGATVASNDCGSSDGGCSGGGD